MMNLFNFILIFTLFIQVLSLCKNNCNHHGKCNLWNTCECFTGYEGNDCSRKICPKGPAMTGIPHAKDSAHEEIECSGKGSCDHSSGICTCYDGYSGMNCARTKCLNDCSGKGVCISIRKAAEENDGFRLNRTTSYDLWDADLIYGCKCDYGFSGADCSERTCEYSVDPRLSDLNHEIISLVCDCTQITCKGKFKFRYFGMPFKNWLTPSSNRSELIRQLSYMPGINDLSGSYALPSLALYNNTNDGPICVAGVKTLTQIKFKRNAGDMPALSFYANLLTKGSIYFETKQILSCDCISYSCDGVFRLSFDGVMSTRIPSNSSGISILYALSNISTVYQSGFTVSVDHPSLQLCSKGELRNISITFTGSSGNAPPIKLWSSVVSYNVTNYYSSNYTSNVLTLFTYDGRSDSVKLCGGIGKCNFTTGQCICPYGWGFDADLGPCSYLQANTSAWPGLGRCPGTISYKDLTNSNPKSLDSTANYGTTIYISMNPISHFTNEIAKIYSFHWSPVTLYGARVDVSSGKLFRNLTSNQSAGPILLDQAKEQVIFIDASPSYSYIGFASRKNSSLTTIWYHYTYKIFGLAFDAHFKRRKLYWTVPGYSALDDGNIYWGYADEDSPTIYSLASIIGQSHIVSPHGLAINYQQKRIYWTDRNLTNGHGVIRSSDLDGSNYKQYKVLKSIDNQTISMNLTDIVIHISNNNTALVLDSLHSASIFAINLDSPIIYNNDTEVETAFENYLSARLIVNSSAINMSSPRYLMLDDVNYYILWSDISKYKIGYARYRTIGFDPFSPGTAFSPHASNNFLSNYAPIAMMMDRGLGKIEFENYLDCYGHGVCLGVEGNWECSCHKGYFGDCQAKSCPVGKAWFQEPAVDNIGHDEYIECSNRGVCDRATGECTCQNGYEGSACERLSCPEISDGIPCGGRGKCLSMRLLANHHRDEYLNPSPVNYGSSPHIASAWDADMIYGCVADRYGFFNAEYNISSPSGTNLRQYDCPAAFNYRLLANVISQGNNYTTNHTNHREIQTINCRAFTGYFQVSFRGEESGLISVNATKTELKDILEAMTTVGSVDVSFSNSNLCSDIFSYSANVTFLSVVGKIPLLEVSSTYNISGLATSISIYRTQSASNIDVQECSGYGDCNSQDGYCYCYTNYGTSDGEGNPGGFGDCGYYIPNGYN